MMRVLVTGGFGMLASSLIATLRSDFEIILTAPEKKQVAGYENFDFFSWDIRQKAGSWQEQIGPIDAVLHTAAYTKVDLCESNPSLAFAVNDEGSRRVVDFAQRKNARLIYFSSDYVFDGKKQTPYVESDPTSPVSVYGESKLRGEKAVLEYTLGTVLRVSWLFGGGTQYHNFVNSIVKSAENKASILKVVNDQIGRPTYTETVAQVVKALLLSNPPKWVFLNREIFHLANRGVCSWFDFAKEIVDCLGNEKEVIAITSQELLRPAKRPSYSVFSTEKIESFLSFDLKSWQQCVREYVSVWWPQDIN